MFRNIIAHIISSSSSLSPTSGTDIFELPLQESLVSDGRKNSNESRSGHVSATQPRSRRIVIVSTAIAISIRVLLFSLIVDNAQCSVTSIGVR